MSGPGRHWLVEHATTPAHGRLQRFTKSVAFQLRLAQAASFQAYAERAREPGLLPGRYAILQLIGDHPGWRATRARTTRRSIEYWGQSGTPCCGCSAC